MLILDTFQLPLSMEGASGILSNSQAIQHSTVSVLFEFIYFLPLNILNFQHSQAEYVVPTMRSFAATPHQFINSAPMSNSKAPLTGVTSLPPQSVDILRFTVVRGPAGYGFTLNGQFPCALSIIQPGGAADRSGLRRGDLLLELNDLDIRRSPHDEVVRLVSSARESIRIIVARSPNRPPLQPRMSNAPTSSAASISARPFAPRSGEPPVASHGIGLYRPFESPPPPTVPNDMPVSVHRTTGAALESSTITHVSRLADLHELHEIVSSNAGWPRQPTSAGVSVGAPTVPQSTPSSIATTLVSSAISKGIASVSTLPRGGGGGGGASRWSSTENASSRRSFEASSTSGGAALSANLTGLTLAPSTASSSGSSSHTRSDCSLRCVLYYAATIELPSQLGPNAASNLRASLQRVRAEAASRLQSLSTPSHTAHASARTSAQANAHASVAEQTAFYELLVLSDTLELCALASGAGGGGGSSNSQSQSRSGDGSSTGGDSDLIRIPLRRVLCVGIIPDQSDCLCLLVSHPSPLAPSASANKEAHTITAPPVSCHIFLVASRPKEVSSESRSTGLANETERELSAAGLAAHLVGVLAAHAAATTTHGQAASATPATAAAQQQAALLGLAAPAVGPLPAAANVTAGAIAGSNKQPPPPPPHKTAPTDSALSVCFSCSSCSSSKSGRVVNE